MSRCMDGKPYENLANSIIIRAADDYREAYECGDKYTLCEVELFFKSDWIQALTNLDGREILRRLQNECKSLFGSDTCY